MGCGKSTVGRRLAAQRACRYVDNDETIAEFSGWSTVALAQAGGSLLHDWESRYAHYVRDLSAPLVAGLPASVADRGEELAMLRSTGTLVYLRCDADTLVGRVSADGPRPWLDGEIAPIIAKNFDRRDAALAAGCDVVIDAGQPVELVLAALTALTAIPAVPEPR